MGAATGGAIGAVTGAGKGSGPSNDVAGTIEPVLESMGYELVDLEFGASGLLRVTIDLADGSRHVQVEDCEQVSHQLSRLFLVEDVDYSRLEISSPGLDRPLKKAADFIRFAGEKISLRLRQPIDGRKQFTGVLLSPEAAQKQAGSAIAQGEVMATGADPVAAAEPLSGQVRPDHWVLVWSDEPEPAGRRPGRTGKAVVKTAKGGKAVKGGKARGAAAVTAGTMVADAGDKVRLLPFTLDQIDKARLVPKLVF